MAVDDSGNVYVTGQTPGTEGDPDYATIKYDPSGNEVWVERYDGPYGGPVAGFDGGRDLAVDSVGNVYVNGFSDGILTVKDCTTIRYAQFWRGDVNQSGAVEAGDVVYLISYLFRGGTPPLPILQAGDANCDGVVQSGDVVYVISYLFRGGSPPCD